MDDVPLARRALRNKRRRREEPESRPDPRSSGVVAGQRADGGAEAAGAAAVAGVAAAAVGGLPQELGPHDDGCDGSGRYTLRPRRGQAAANASSVGDEAVALTAGTAAAAGPDAKPSQRSRKARGRGRGGKGAKGGGKQQLESEEQHGEGQQEKRESPGLRHGTRQEAARPKHDLERLVFERGRRHGKSATDVDSEYQLEEDEEVEEEEEEGEGVEVVEYGESDEAGAAARGRKARVKRSSCKLPIALRLGRRGPTRAGPAAKVATAPAAAPARKRRANRVQLASDSEDEDGPPTRAASLADVGADTDEEDGAKGERDGGRRGVGAGRLRRAVAARVAAAEEYEEEEEEEGLEDALEDDDDADAGRKPASAKAAAAKAQAGGAEPTATWSSSLEGMARPITDGGVRGRAQRSRRERKERRALTQVELREKARRRLERAQEGVDDGTDDGSNEEDDEAEPADTEGAYGAPRRRLCGSRGGQGRRRRLQHPGLQEDGDVEIAALYVHDSDEDEAAAAERALEDDIEEEGPGRRWRKDGGGGDDRGGDEDSGSESLGSFIDDGPVQEGEASSEEEEILDDEDAEAADGDEPRTPRRQGNRSGGGGGGGGAATGVDALRSPPVAGKIHSDPLENFKSWVMPTLYRLLNLQVHDEDEAAMQQHEMDQRARAERFENDLNSAKERTKSYSWVHAVTKLGLQTALERYPTLLIAGLAPSQFYGCVGAQLVQAAIAAQSESDGPCRLGDEAEERGCDICHAHRTHHLHKLTVEGDSLPPANTLNAASVGAEGTAEGGAGPLQSAAGGGAEGSREFYAGGICCDRVVLFHAICHFRRWLVASLKRRLKYLLRADLRRLGPGEVLSDEARQAALLRLLNGEEDKSLCAMYCKFKELMEAANKLYMLQNSKDSYRPGRVVAEIMYELHPSADGYESDIPGIPPEEDEEDEEEDGEAAEEGEGKEDVEDGAGEHDGDAAGDDGGAGGDEGDSDGDGGGGGSGRCSKRRKRRRAVIDDDGCGSDGDSARADADGGGGNESYGGATAPTSVPIVSPVVGDIRDATRRKRAAEAAAAARVAVAAATRAAELADAADDAKAARLANAAATVAAAAAAALDKDLKSPSSSRSLLATGSGRQMKISELLSPQGGGLPSPPRPRLKPPEAASARGAGAGSPATAAAAVAPVPLIELLDSSGDEASDAQAEATGPRGAGATAAATAGGSVDLQENGPADATELPELLRGGSSDLAPLPTTLPSPASALVLAQQLAAAEAATQVQPVQGPPTQPPQLAGGAGRGGGSNLARHLNLASAAAVASLTTQQPPPQYQPLPPPQHQPQYLPRYQPQPPPQPNYQPHYQPHYQPQPQYQPQCQPQDLQQPQQPQQLPSSAPRTGLDCFRCGQQGHWSNNCPQGRGASR